MSTEATPNKSEAPAGSEDAPPASAEDPSAPAEPSTAPDASKTPIQQLWVAAQANGHPEIWGVTLADPETHVPTQIVLQKYLNANDGDVTKATDQLTKTLAWRSETKPLDLLTKAFNRAKFEGLGFVTEYGGPAGGDPESREVFTWNIYGGVKNIEETFGVLAE